MYITLLKIKASNSPRLFFHVSQLNHLLSISYNICKKNTTLLLHKGVHIDEEIVQATKYWDFTHVLHENEREKGSFILELKNIIKSIT